jgi:hypothetical protein
MVSCRPQAAHSACASHIWDVAAGQHLPARDAAAAAANPPTLALCRSHRSCRASCMPLITQCQLQPAPHLHTPPRSRASSQPPSDHPTQEDHPACSRLTRSAALTPHQQTPCPCCSTCLASMAQAWLPTASSQASATPLTSEPLPSLPATGHHSRRSCRQPR